MSLRDTMRVGKTLWNGLMRRKVHKKQLNWNLANLGWNQHSDCKKTETWKKQYFSTNSVFMINLKGVKEKNNFPNVFVNKLRNLGRMDI
jgi:hypothetical protein